MTWLGNRAGTGGGTFGSDAVARASIAAIQADNSTDTERLAAVTALQATLGDKVDQSVYDAAASANSTDAERIAAIAIIQAQIDALPTPDDALSVKWNTTDVYAENALVSYNGGMFTTAGAAANLAPMDNLGTGANKWCWVSGTVRVEAVIAASADTPEFIYDTVLGINYVLKEAGGVYAYVQMCDQLFVKPVFTAQFDVADAGGSSTVLINKSANAGRWEVYEGGVLAASYAGNTATHVFAAGTNNYWLLVLDDNDPETVTRFQAPTAFLTAIDVSAFSDLRQLRVQDNNISVVDVTNNTALLELQVQENNLTAIDITANTALTDLRVFDNSLTALDTTNNPAITRYWAYNNQITVLDVSSNVAVTSLQVYDNQLSTLDVSTNTVVNTLRIFGNMMPTSVVDAILNDVDGFGTSGGLILCQGANMGAPSAGVVTGAVANLQGRGWTVTTS